MSTEAKVHDIDTDNAILVARLLDHADDEGNDGRTRDALKRIGLSELIPTGKKPFTADLSELIDNLPRTSTIDIDIFSDGTPNLYQAETRLHRLVAQQVDAVIASIRDRAGDILTPASDDSKAIDRHAIIEQWGKYHTPYPAAGNTEVDNHRRRLITKVRSYGEQHGWCGELEDTIERIGLGSYLTETATVDLTQLRELAVPIRLTRNGTREDELPDAIANAVREAISRHPELAVITDEAPETSAH
ncbi:hypothetical protein [Nocardia carnea]|uniref:hypothetical protein n=1 Tax=Nocardia carnea TaxID=37328 RepID=UPI0024553587|nr:hypothetical protein [Nocardia carnea]